MQTRYYGLLPALVLVLMVLFANTDANAQCVQDDPTCGVFNGNIIQFLGTEPATCNLPSGSATFVPCNKFNFSYTGSSTNQIIVAIPKAAMKQFTSADASIAGCSQLITDGSGDPTTHFAVNLLTHNVCRVAVTGTALGTPFSLRAGLNSIPLPLDWQLRTSANEVFFDLLNGPSPIGGLAVQETGTTLKSDGTTLKYTNVNGEITIIEGTGRVVPLSDTKLCVVNADPNVGGNLIGLDGRHYTCETVTFATEQCDIKTSGGDPLRYSGGSGIIFP